MHAFAWYSHAADSFALPCRLARRSKIHRDWTLEIATGGAAITSKSTDRVRHEVCQQKWKESSHWTARIDPLASNRTRVGLSG